MKYPKPKGFSDPQSDWEGCEEIFQQITAKDDDRLTTDEFGMIFHHPLPAADYEEGAYYIEKCFEHIGTGREIKHSHWPEGFLGWLDNSADRLEADGLMAEVRRLILCTFWRLVDSFELFDLSGEQCAALGLSAEYSVGPYNCTTVWDFIDELTLYDRFHPECEAIVSSLVASEQPAHVRWYLEIARHTRVWALIYRPDASDDFVRKEELFHRLHRFADYKGKIWPLMMDAYKTAADQRYLGFVSLF